MEIQIALAVLLVGFAGAPPRAQAQTPALEALRAGLSPFGDSSSVGATILDLDALKVRGGVFSKNDPETGSALRALGQSVGATSGSTRDARVCNAAGTRTCRLVGASRVIAVLRMVVGATSAELEVRTIQETGNSRIPLVERDTKVVLEFSEGEWRVVRTQLIRIT